MAKRKTPKKAKPVNMEVEMSEEKVKQVAEQVEPIIDRAVAKIILATFDELVEEHEGDRETAVMELIDMGEKIMNS